MRSVKHLLIFLKLVISRTFERTMWLFHAAEFLLYEASLKHPEIPRRAWEVVFLCVLFSSCYRVWKEQLAAVETLHNQLEDFKNDIPTFYITVGKVKQFSARSIVDKCKTEIGVTGRVVDANNQVKKADGRLSTLSSFMSSALPAMLWTETADEKLSSLRSYLKRLEKYEEKLERLYQVELTVTGSRSDANIEIWLECEEAQEMIVEDNYPRRHLPIRKSKYDLSGIPATVPSLAVPNKLWLASHSTGRGAYSRIASLSAQHPFRIFDEDFYILTDKTTLHVTAKVTSPKRREPQVIPLEISLTERAVEFIEPWKPRTYEEIMEQEL